MTTVKEGFCWKEGGFVANWRRRWLTLRGDGLLFYSRRSQGAEQPKGTLCLGSVATVSVEHDVTIAKPKVTVDVIVLATALRTLRFFPEDAAEITRWTVALQEVIHRPRLYSLSVAAVPADYDEDDTPASASASVKAPPQRQSVWRQATQPRASVARLAASSRDAPAQQDSQPSPQSSPPQSSAEAVAQAQAPASFLEEYAVGETPVNLMVYRPAPTTLSAVLQGAWASHHVFVCTTPDEARSAVARGQFCYWRVLQPADGSAGADELLPALVQGAREAHNTAAIVLADTKERLLESPEIDRIALEFRGAYRDESRIAAECGRILGVPRPGLSAAHAHAGSQEALLVCCELPESPEQWDEGRFYRIAPAELAYRGASAMLHPGLIRALLCGNHRSAAADDGMSDSLIAVAGVLAHSRACGLPFEEAARSFKLLFAADYAYDRLGNVATDVLETTLKSWLMLLSLDGCFAQEFTRCLAEVDADGLRCFRNYALGLRTLFEAENADGTRVLPEFSGKCFRVASLTPQAARQRYQKGTRICSTTFCATTKSKAVADSRLKRLGGNTLFVVYTAPPVWERQMCSNANVSLFSVRPEDETVLFLPLVQFYVAGVSVPPKPSAEDPIVITLYEDYDFTAPLLRCWRVLQECIDQENRVKDIHLYFENNTDLWALLAVDKRLQPDGTLVAVNELGEDGEVVTTASERMAMKEPLNVVQSRVQMTDGNRSLTEVFFDDKLQPESKQMLERIFEKRAADGRAPPISGLQAALEFAYFLEGTPLIDYNESPL